MLKVDQWLDEYYNELSCDFQKLVDIEVPNIAQKWTLVTQRISQHPENIMSLTLRAIMYEWGQGVEQNYPKAIRLYQMATNKGGSIAMCNLADMYHFGLGFVKNDTTATHLYQMAIDKGNSVAMCNLALIYRINNDDINAYHEVIRLYNMAIAQGNSFAMTSLAILYYTGSEGIEKNYSKAQKLFHMASDKGEPMAINMLKFCF